MRRFMITCRTKPLDATTWPDFARLVEANNGMWGGCWCMWYHSKNEPRTPEAKRKAKECLVRECRAHAALAYDGKDCVGWCQFGSATSCRAFITSAPILRPIRRYLTGASPASFPAKAVAAKALPRVR